VRDFGAWLVLAIGLAAALSIPCMLAVVVYVRRLMRDVSRIAAAIDGGVSAEASERVGIVGRPTTREAVSAR
jgi:hypothetical protein